MDYLMHINGQQVGEHLDKITIYNPADGERVGSVPNGGKQEAQRAIQAAHDAFTLWSQKTAYERSAYLKTLNDLLIDHQDELGQLMTREMGKPIKESVGEVTYAATFVEWYAEEAKRIYGETIPSHINSKRMQVWKKPIGVVGAITPWNFPLAMITRKIAPALAAGCTVIVKPSSESPLTALKFIELAQEAGFPDGVINVITGSSSAIVGEMMHDERIRKITFTGSTEVGKLLIEQSAQNVKKLSLELGGHAPFIIFDDADIDKAVEHVIASKFRNSGQTCVCANRIYVQEKIYETFVTRFAKRVEKMTIGDGIDETVDIGPLINEDGLKKVTEQVDDALKNGATIVTGGKKLERQGLFYAPTVIRDVHPSMNIMQEETCGPVAPVQKFATEDEAIALANSTEFGLAAYVFTENVAKGMRIIEQLDFGIVGWNDGLPSAAQAPFGGLKESGFGREGGREGIDAFLETQYVSIGID